MRILFDQCTPEPLRRFLTDATVVTASEQGWGNLSNGTLIAKAEEAGFDILVTTDRNLRYQQNLAVRALAIAVVLQPAWPVLRDRAESVAEEITRLRSGEFIEI